MKTREQLNQENYQRAVRLAEMFDDELKAEYLEESTSRYAFEQQAVKNLQKLTTLKPLVALILLVMITIVSLAIYAQTERYTIVQQGLQLHQKFQDKVAEQNSEQKNDTYIISLQNQLRENPNNGDLWYELGQAYALNNDFDASLISYQNAAKVLGETPAILGAMATVDYYQKGQKMSPQAQAWIAQALAKDPKESASLLLLASDGFLNNNYEQALDNWRKVLDSENESIDRRAIIQSMEMARQMLMRQK